MGTRRLAFKCGAGRNAVNDGSIRRLLARRLRVEALGERFPDQAKPNQRCSDDWGHADLALQVAGPAFAHETDIQPNFAITLQLFAPDNGKCGLAGPPRASKVWSQSSPKIVRLD